MKPIWASLKLRPTRIGFLVEPEDAISLRKIFEVCTCLWGGSFNPVIPVCTSLPDAWRAPYQEQDPIELAQGYIRFFEPDVFVEAKQGLADKIGICKDKFGFDLSRVVGLDSFFNPQGQYEDEIPLGTSILHVYRHLYEKEFKFVSRHQRQVALFLTDPPNALFSSALYGGFPDVGRLAYLSHAYFDAFDATTLDLTSENWVRTIKEDFQLPIDFTEEHLNIEPNGWDDPTIFVVDPTSTLDLIDLWDVRQFHSNILPISIHWLSKTKGFINRIVKRNHRPLPGNPHGIMIQTTIHFARSISEDRAKAATKELNLEGLENACFTRFGYDDIWLSHRNEFAQRPQRTQITATTGDLELTIDEEEDTAPACRFRSLSPEFAPRFGGNSRWVNILQLKYRADYTLALALPLTFINEPQWRLRIGEPTIISREGFVLPQKYKNHDEYFRLLTGRKAIIYWLKSHGVEAQPSDAGRITDQVLASLEGFWGTRLIADRDTLVLLDEMSKSVTKYLDGKEEEFPERSVEVEKWKAVIHRRANSSFTGDITLDAFVKAKIFRLGLVLECTNCQKKNWFGIDNLREQLLCERCLKNYEFPQGSLNFGRTPWHYRVIGPFSVPNFAGGAYSTVLALNLFARKLTSDHPNLTFATGLEFKVAEEKPFEVDFTFWYQRKRGLDLLEEPNLVFGEAKSLAIESFKQDDFKRMRRLAEKFPGAFLVLATLKESLSDAEKIEAAQLALWGRERKDGFPRTPVLVLTGLELFCPWNLKEAWRHRGDRWAKFAEQARFDLDNLWTLAEITQQLYLGLPDPYSRPASASVASGDSAPAQQASTS